MGSLTQYRTTPQYMCSLCWNTTGTEEILFSMDCNQKGNNALLQYFSLPALRCRHVGRKCRASHVKLGQDPPCQLTDSQAHLPPNAKVQGGRLQNESFVRKLREARLAERRGCGLWCHQGALTYISRCHTDKQYSPPSTR